MHATCDECAVKQGRLDEAEPLFKRVHKIQLKLHGENHIQMATSFAWLAEIKKARVRDSMYSSVSDVHHTWWGVLLRYSYLRYLCLYAGASGSVQLHYLFFHAGVSGPVQRGGATLSKVA